MIRLTSDRLRTGASFRALAYSTILGGGLVFAVACSSDDDPATPSTPLDSGAPDGNGVSPDGDRPTDPSDASDASGPDPQPSILPLPTTAHARLFGVTYASDGSIFAVGQAGTPETPNDLALLLVKLTPAGALDTTFNTTGYVVKNVSTGLAGENFRGIVVQTEGANAGKVVVAGAAEHDQSNPSATTRDIVVVRFNANGTVDETFGDDGVARFPLGDGTNVQQWGLSKYPNDDLLVTGACAPVASDFPVNATLPQRSLAVLRLKGTDGTFANFGIHGAGVFRLPFEWNVNPRTATILSDGSAIIAGYRAAGSGGLPNRPVISKLTPAGALDTTFGTNGVFFPESDVPGFGTGAVVEAYGVVPQGTKFVTTGYGKESSSNTSDGWVSLRLFDDGGIDDTYGNDGHVFFSVNEQNANSRGLFVLPDERVVLLGGASPPKPTPSDPTQSQYAAIAILQPNGAPDPAFSAAGPKLYDLGGPATGRASHFFWSGAVSPDHTKLIVVGIRGAVTANDAGIPVGTDQAAVLFLPLAQ